VRAPAPKGTVLFLHGYPETLTVWKDIATTLAADYDVHAFDWPGYGQSSRPAFERFSYAPKAYALVLNPALRSFSVGVRSYYFTFAAAFWFLGPIPFAVATILSVGILIWRQSWSDAAKGIMAIRKLLD
ncbi:alpha/beta fold hydrolase, partial [Rhizobium johnstonii]